MSKKNQQLCMHLAQTAAQVGSAASQLALKGGNPSSGCAQNLDRQVVQLFGVVRAMRKLGAGMQFTIADSNSMSDYLTTRYGDASEADAA